MTLNNFENITKQIFLIPPNQRGFAWGKEHFEALIRDMIIATNIPSQPHHYAGPIVVSKTGKPNIEADDLTIFPTNSLEDGQQRVTTLMILAKNLSSKIMETFPAGSAEYLNGSNLKNCFMYVKGQTSFSKLVNANSNFNDMLKHILLSQGALPTLDSPPLKALNSMNTTISTWVDELPVPELSGWASKVKSSLQFTLINLGASINKFLAFDAINSRGIGLSEFDKVKNFCCLVYSIRKIKGGKPDAKWILALKALQVAECDSRTHENTFICDLFNVHHKQKIKIIDGVHSQMMKIYEDLLYRADTVLENSLKKFVNEWESWAKSYGFIETNKRGMFYPGGAQTQRCNANGKKSMMRLDNLDYRAISRLILTTCHRRLTPTDFAKSAELIEKFIFRVYGVMNKKTSTNSTKLIQASSAIYHGQDYAYLEGVICYLIHRDIAGASMRSVIERLSNGSTKYPWENGGWDRCFYFLYEFETRASQDYGAWKKLNAQQKQSIEHILPKSREETPVYWDAIWNNEFEFEKNRHRLGNLVLTKDTGANSKLGQKSIDLKISDRGNQEGRYDYSNGTSSEKEIHSHADAFGQREWKLKNILHRELKLIKWAAERWKIKCCDDNGTITLPTEFTFEQGEANETITIDTAARNCISGIEPDFPGNRAED